MIASWPDSRNGALMPDEVQHPVEATMAAAPSRKRKKHFLLEQVEYLVFRGLTRIMRSVTSETASRWGRALGSASGRIIASRSRRALANLHAVFPELSEEGRRELVRKCWKHFGDSALQYLRYVDGGLDELVTRSEVADRETFERVFAENRGIIVVTPHFGSWELAGLLLGTFGLPVTLVARSLDNRLLNRDLEKSRTRSTLEIVDRRRAARPLVRALERKSIVVLLPDQGVKPRDGLLVPFLGRDAWTTSAPARLALRFDSPIAVVFCPPVPGGCRIEIATIIDPVSLPAAERSVAAITRKINDVFSERIRRDPEYWLWMHDRWKGTSG